MPEVWLDTSVLGDIVDGNRDLELALRLLHAPLLIVPKVREELLSGNPLKPGGPAMNPAKVAIAQDVIRRLGVQLDLRGSPAVRRALFEKQFKFKPKPGQPGRFTTVLRSIEESDAIVLSEIAASAKERGIARPRLITTDQRLVNAGDAKAWGVEITLPDPALVADARARRARLEDAVRSMVDGVRRQVDQLSGEHKLQRGIILDKPSVVGFFGFWTNRLFNTDVPEMDIWNPAFASLDRAARFLREGDLPQASAAAFQARGNMLKAAVVYRRWKDGIEQAGVKMQVTIGLVAAALILAAVAAFAAGVAATSGANAAATVQGLADLVAKGDALALRVAVAGSGPAAATAMQEWEAALAEVEEFTEQVLTR